MIFVADRNPAAGDDQIAAGRRVAQRRAGGSQRVFDDAQVLHFAARGLQQRAQREAVAVVDGTRAQRLARHHQLVAGREDGHPRPAQHTQAGGTNRRRQPQRLRIQALAACQHGRTLEYVFATAANPLAGPGHGVDTHHAAIKCHALLLHHHRVGAGRHLAASKDAGRGARLKRLADVAGGDSLRHRQQRAGGGHVGAAQRVTVHRRVVLRRHVQCRQHIGGQHPPQRVEGADRLCLIDAVGHRPLHQPGQRFVQAQHRALLRDCTHLACSAM